PLISYCPHYQERYHHHLGLLHFHPHFHSLHYLDHRPHLARFPHLVHLDPVPLPLDSTVPLLHPLVYLHLLRHLPGLLSLHLLVLPLEPLLPLPVPPLAHLVLPPAPHQNRPHFPKAVVLLLHAHIIPNQQRLRDLV